MTKAQKMLILIFAVFLILIFTIFITLGNFIYKIITYKDYDDIQNKLAKKYDYLSYDKDRSTIYFNNEIIVIVDDSISHQEAKDYLIDFCDDIDDELSDIGFYRLVFDKKYLYEELEEFIFELEDTYIVDRAFINTASEIIKNDFEYPNDPWSKGLFNKQKWTDFPDGNNWSLEAINIRGAWEHLDEMKNVRVGVIDEYPNKNHEDINFKRVDVITYDKSKKYKLNKFKPKKGFHGTHVSGTIGATYNNKKGLSGILADKGELYFTTAYYKDGRDVELIGNPYSYIKSIRNLLKYDVRVINISLGGRPIVGIAASNGNEKAINLIKDMAEIVETGLKRIIKERKQQNKPDFLICVSAGNSNFFHYKTDKKSNLGYKIVEKSSKKTKNGDAEALYNSPFTYIKDSEVKNRIIVVGSLGMKENIKKETPRYEFSFFSSIGERIDILAPGEDVYSCSKGKYSYKKSSGTSMASPHVAGVCGLIFAINENLSAKDVKKIVTNSTKGRYYYLGGYSGMLDAELSVDNAIKSKKESVSRILKTEKDDGLDLCFVVDTTYSMEDDIDDVKKNMKSILNALSNKTNNFRVSVVDYRDFPERTLESRDYPSDVKLDFTNNKEEIISAIDNLYLGDGGDNRETVYSGIMTALSLDWRVNSKKTIIILGDAAPHDPEPVTDYRYEDILNSLKNSKISLYDQSEEPVIKDFDDSSVSVNAIGEFGYFYNTDFFEKICEETGGLFSDVKDSNEVSKKIVDSIEEIEIEEYITKKVIFSKYLRNEKIDIYNEEKKYLFSFIADNDGNFLLEDMTQGKYYFESKALKCTGYFEIKDNDETIKSNIKYKNSYYSIIKIYRDNKKMINNSIILTLLELLAGLITILVMAVYNENKNY